ncbi:polyhydroxyalkanoate synthase [Chitinivorax tropicus]|uniref:Polyhydroxyalkanoate synthase n=1 Tax=Chitinivorax tropicus TaxID=714531 RepID=A0A840MHK4_9PROT|nr:class I poly(R)-hydroxyalkanoic acid synthase [Chitinivorax tropicus]MBB5017870.1 polyhydroxyalkanoate synthase [Chitinivorax tropicus]
MTNARSPDPASLAMQWQDVMQRSQRMLADFLSRQDQEQFSVLDPTMVGRLMQDWSRQWLAHPQQAWQQQMAFWQDAAALWRQSFEHWALQAKVEPVVAPMQGDKRFKDETWAQHAVFDFIKQSYLLTANHALAAVEHTEGLDGHTRKQVAFYMRQFVDAMSPTNFAATNPQVIKETLETNGENLIQGLRHLLDDLERGNGRLATRMTDLSAFRLGENIATTPGKVVFQNALMQLIQYAPSTEKVFQRPLLVIPPWINKYYILDLKPKNSLIKWAVDQGHTVFVISWVNPDASLRNKHFEDYMQEGPLAALDAIQQATGEKDVKALAYCIGGTLLASTLAYMAARRDSRIKSATFMTTLMDFSDIGELEVFVDEAQIARLEAYMDKKGYLEGHQMAEVFNLLRENDLIWSFVINNYLMGREPMAFDLLYWNSDSTRMPAAMHGFYLRNMYLYNRLREPAGITLAGVPIDLRKIKTPAYWISTREDHIAPWKTTYLGTRLLTGPKRFVLGGSGHIAGIVNPPSANKYGYMTNEVICETAEEWLQDAQAHEGSWWQDWAEWVKPFNGKLVAARTPGAGQLPALDDAPGSYVKLRL